MYHEEKRELEADLDPPNTKRTRPGKLIAKVALANVGAIKPKSRPGQLRAARKVGDTSR